MAIVLASLNFLVIVVGEKGSVLELEHSTIIFVPVKLSFLVIFVEKEGRALELRLQYLGLVQICDTSSALLTFLTSYLLCFHFLCFHFLI